MIPVCRCSLLYGLLWLRIGLAVAQGSEPVDTVTDCQLEDQVQRCTSGDDEYFVEISPSQTGELPSEYTDCHQHDADLFCYGEDGEEVFVRATDPSLAEAAEEDEHSDHEGHDHGDDEDHEGHDHGDDEDHEGHDHGEEDEEEEEEGEGGAVGAVASEGQDCHFHAGVEHCTGPESAESGSALSCDRVERDYDVSLRIGTLFVVLVTSSIGVYSPILLARAARHKALRYAFLVMKQFGVGVIISTAFVHLYTHANLMFDNECLGDLDYESTTAAIVMAGIFISFLIDFVAHRFVRWRRSKSAGSGTGNDSDVSIDRAVYKAGHSTKLDVIVLEAGIIFHSLLLGLTSVVADDSFYITIFIVVVFHQFFEGIALGTRIADIPSPASSSAYYPTDPQISPKSTLSLPRKLLLALPYSLVTPLGMAIGIGVLDSFNGNDPATIATVGTLDALSAGILIWVGLVEMLAKDWLHEGGELARAGIGKILFAGLGGLVPGLIIMSLLGKWI